MIYEIESGSRSDGLFLYLRNKRTGKCPHVNVRWKWMCLHTRQSGIELPFIGFTVEHGKYTRKLELYFRSSMGWRLCIGKVDSEWSGCKVWLFPTRYSLLARLQRRGYWHRRGWGIALHEPFLRNKWSA